MWNCHNSLFEFRYSICSEQKKPQNSAQKVLPCSSCSHTEHEHDGQTDIIMDSTYSARIVRRKIDNKTFPTWAEISARPSISLLKVKGKVQTRSLFIWLIKPNVTHYLVKLHQHLTSCFKVIRNFLIPKILIPKSISAREFFQFVRGHRHTNIHTATLGQTENDTCFAQHYRHAVGGFEWKNS